MFRIKIIFYRVNIITILFLFCCIITQSAAEDNNGTAGPNSETKQAGQTEEKKDLDKRGNFDFSLPGDNKTQSIDLFFELPFEGKWFEGKFNGNYFTTFRKEDIPQEDSVWIALQRSFTGWTFHSRSYAYSIESSTLGTFAVGEYVEYENDYSIETDPHLHTSIYGQYKPWESLEFALGGWIEFQKLGEETDEETDENGRFRSGIRTHVNMELEFSWINLSLLVEYLPHWSFKSYHLNTSPEIELKINNLNIPLKKDNITFSIVLHGEIDYYYDNTENEILTVEPLFEVNPLEVRWTQLIRHKF